MKSFCRKYIFIFLLIIQLLLLLYYGSLKKGMHFDECFSYFNTNNSVGRQVFDRSIISSEDIMKDFYVLPDEKFNYSYVVTLQSYDVHPPLFYLFLHTLCSFMPNVFSIWQGISLNILYALLTSIFLYLIIKELTNNERITNLILSLIIINPAIISNVMFIRMYCLLTLWFSILIYLHIKISKTEDINHLSLKYPIIAAVITYLGFMTHYYYLVFLFFVEAAFWIPRLFNFKNNYKGFIKYFMCQLFAGILGIFSYPAALGHVNSGYRGVEVKENLLNFSDIKLRFTFFNELMNKYLFQGSFYIVLLIVCILLVTAYFFRKNKKTSDFNFSQTFTLLIIPSLGFYLICVKSALIGDDAMMRYLLPIFPFIIIFTAILIIYLLKFELNNKKAVNILLSFAYILFVIISVISLINKKVFYLYPEVEHMNEIAENNSDNDCLYIYNNDETKYFLWNDYDQLSRYENVYFADINNSDAISDPMISESDRLIVYICKMGEHEDFLDYEQLIYTSNKKLHTYQKLYDGMYATCYEFY